MPISSLSHMFYSGYSMHPTLKDGDVLYIVPYNGKEIYSGDVIVFWLPGRCRYVAHRVGSVSSRWIKTLGDSNTEIDNHVLQQDQVVGRVAYVFRKHKRIRIYRGNLGRLFLMKNRVIRRIRPFFISVMLPIYRYFINLRLVAHIVPHMKFKIVTFKRPDGNDRKLFSGSRVIGWYIPKNSQWRIKPPFKLLVDEEALLFPKENHCSSSTGETHQ